MRLRRGMISMVVGIYSQNILVERTTPYTKDLKEEDRIPATATLSRINGEWDVAMRLTKSILSKDRRYTHTVHCLSSAESLFYFINGEYCCRKKQ